MYVHVGRQMRRLAGKRAGGQAGSQAATRNQAAASTQPAGQPAQAAHSPELRPVWNWGCESRARARETRARAGGDQCHFEVCGPSAMMPPTSSTQRFIHSGKYVEYVWNTNAMRWEHAWHMDVT